MRAVPTRVHVAIHYLIGAVLLVTSFVFGGEGDTRSMPWIAFALGWGVILYGILAAYQVGSVRHIPAPVHLAFDFTAGLMLITSPWLAGLDAYAWVPHASVGGLEIAATVAAVLAPVPAAAVFPSRPL